MDVLQDNPKCVGVFTSRWLPMSRSYRNVRLKKDRVYDVDDLCSKYNVCKNTVSNWVQTELKPIDKKRPNLFRGAALNLFHKERRQRSKVNLRAGEFKCTGCKAAVFPLLETLTETKIRNGIIMYFAHCPDCNAMVRKISSEADRDYFAHLRNPNTTVGYPHEVNRAVSAGIGINEEKFEQDWWSTNDRIIFAWQSYAGRYDEKTVDRHLAAIRYCEDVTNGKAFHLFTVQDASKVRDDLKRRAIPGAKDYLSKSSVLHFVSHLKSFFGWLLKQDGYKRLPGDLPDYFDMPRSVFSKVLPRESKHYLSINEAAQLLQQMSARSLQAQRDRAIFAIAYLGALRADTIVSLRLCHLDISNKRIIQDANVVRAKNGKSLTVSWFPILDIFHEVVVEWAERLASLGFTGDDALFPSNKLLMNKKASNNGNHASIPVMATTHAVTKAFATACRHNKEKITPHSAKHSIAAERDQRRLSHEQRKAWSENMGHENEKITERHYGKLTDERRFELLEDAHDIPDGISVNITDEEKIALVDSVLQYIKGQCG